MKNEKELSTIAAVMFALNFSIILFYSLICVTTTIRLCQSFGAYDFLSSVRQVPRYPWQMPVQSLSLYALLCAVSVLKNLRPTERFSLRVAICVAEIALCMGVMISLDFYYSGIALLVLTDLVHYIRSGSATAWPGRSTTPWATPSPASSWGRTRGWLCLTPRRRSPRSASRW